MLDIELDLEADLGIDTVKQAEVFATIRESFGIPRDDQLKLRDYPTLSHVLQFVRDRADNLPTTSPTATTPGHAPPTTESSEHVAAIRLEGSIEAANEVPRRVPVPQLRPGLASCVDTGIDLDGARLIVMPDESGVGNALVQRLEQRGAQVLVLDGSDSTETTAESIDEWVAEGPATGVYWLAALDEEPSIADLDLDGWKRHTHRRVKLLHATMHALAVADCAPFLVSATRFGGQHGYGTDGATAPMGGAVSGFTKTYHREQTDALVKVIDFPVSRKTAALADVLIEETERDPGCVEVGHLDGQRWTVGLVEQPALDESEGMPLADDTVFLITGAAGSIVSAITADLARASGGTFHLLDLTPEPDPNDDDLRRFTADREGLKRDIFERLKSDVERATPAMVDRELSRLERLEAAQAAIEAVRDAGGTVHYHSVDLTNGDAVAEVVAAIGAAHERIDVVVHAAGLEVSRYLADKEPSEFALVFDVKSDGWFNLLHAAGDLPIGATVAFSSIAGRFGNGGQTDYSAANDLLCKYCSSFRTTRPDTRAVAIDWTAWAGIGMATRGSIPKMMEMAGIEMLPPDAGIATVRRELTAGPASSEIIVGGALGLLTDEQHPTGGLDLSTGTRGGPVAAAITAAGVHSGDVVETELDPTAQPFLDHHRIDEIPVLPGVMGIEAFAESARLVSPDLSVVAVTGIDFAAPFKFYRDEPRTIEVRLRRTPHEEGLSVECELIGTRQLPDDATQVTTHFTGTVHMRPDVPELPSIDPVKPGDGPTVTSDEIYGVYFHDSAYQVLDEVWGHNGGAIGRIAADLVPDRNPPDEPLVMAPRLIEACFQTAGIWEIGRDGRLALPTHVDSVEVFRQLDDADGTLFAVAESGPAGFDCSVVDEGGRVFVRLRGYRTTPLPDPLDDTQVAPYRRAME